MFENKILHIAGTPARGLGVTSTSRQQVFRQAKLIRKIPIIEDNLIQRMYKKKLEMVGKMDKKNCHPATSEQAASQRRNDKRESERCKAKEGCTCSCGATQSITSQGWRRSITTYWSIKTRPPLVKRFLSTITILCPNP